MDSDTTTKGKILDSLSKYASIFEAFGLVVALASISVQWAQDNRIAKAGHAQAIAEQAAEFHYKIIESETLTQLWYAYGKKENMTLTEKLQYRALLEQYLILHENAFMQHESGLLDERLYRTLNIDLKNSVRRHDLKALEQPLDVLLIPDFFEHLKTLMNGP